MLYLQIGTKLLVGSVGVFIVVRLMGKKSLSDLTPFDLIYTLVLSGILEEGIYDDHITVFHVLFALILWAFVVYGIEKLLEKTEEPSKIIEGEPSFLIDQGKINTEELENNKMKMEQLRKLLRQEGCFNVQDAYYAILEVNGDFSVIKKSEKDSLSVLLIDNGIIDYDTLEKTLEKDEDWLRAILKEKGYTDVNDIYYCEILPNGDLFVYPKEETISGKVPLDE